MTKIKHLNCSEKAKDANQKNSGSYCQGATQRLLDKYKPSRKFTIIDGKNLKDNKPKAA